MFVAECLPWQNSCPCPGLVGIYLHNTWRTIEASTHLVEEITFQTFPSQIDLPWDIFGTREHMDQMRSLRESVPEAPFVVFVIQFYARFSP